MYQLAQDGSQFIKIELDAVEKPDCEIIEFPRKSVNRDSLSEDFNDEIDAWARRTLAANGFGDY